MLLSWSILILMLRELTAVPIQNGHEDEFNSICLTRECINTAAMLLNTMYLTADPCDDFYRFGCGKYEKDAVIPDDKSTTSKLQDIQDLVSPQLRSLVEEPLKPNETKPFSLMKQLYKTCMDKDVIENSGLANVKTIFNNVGGAPFIGVPWNETNFDWIRFAYKYRKEGLFYGQFIGLYVADDAKNASRSMIHINEALARIFREYAMEGHDSKVMKAYYDYLVHLGSLMGGNEEAVKKDSRDIVDFYIKLANITRAMDVLLNDTASVNQMTIKELAEKFPEIPWLEYITTLSDTPELNILETEVVNVEAPSYFPKMLELMKRTPKRVLANYVASEALYFIIPALPEEVRAVKEEFLLKAYGVPAQTRWKQCINEVTKKVNYVLSSSYVRRYFDEASKSTVVDMVANIRKAFIERVQNADWMDDKTRDTAIEKANVMNAFVGYPDELLDNKNLEAYYAGLEPSEEFLTFMLNYEKFSEKQDYEKLRNPVNKTHWSRQNAATEVNAFYSAADNTVTIPAGILQGNVFNNDRPNYMNYGSIGFVIGHEITHGFDSRGRQYDKNGVLNNWWSQAVEETYLNKAQCIVHQYGNYSIPHLNISLNGLITQSENIADNGGVKAAYEAYQEWSKNHPLEHRLPGLNYTPNQMFWIATANVWCSKYSDAALEELVRFNSHSPPNFRVIGSLQNAEDFSRDFNCPLGSKMNPVKKCSVW